MQLYLVYFGANLLGIEANAWTAAAIGLTLYSSARFPGRDLARLHPGGPAGAVGGGASAGARPLPAAPVRHPAAGTTVGFMVQILKGTSLASIIGFMELTRAAQIVNNATFRPFIVYALVAGLYFALCWPLSLLSQALERRLDV